MEAESEAAPLKKGVRPRFSLWDGMEKIISGRLLFHRTFSVPGASIS